MRGVTVPFFISHQGCRERCVFCDQEKIAGSGGTLPTSREILEKIEAYRATAQGRPLEVAFFGGSFSALAAEDQEKLLEPLQPLISRGMVSGVRISTRPDALDERKMAFLQGMGVATVELGAQSMDDEVLELSGRGHKAQHTVHAAGLVLSQGLQLGIQLMPGLPGDTSERSLYSLDRALSLNPSFLRIYPTLVLAGTRLADLYREGGYRPLGMPQALSLCKSILLTALRRGVPVIRMGLQPTAELESAGLVAGPYHPAFGQLVEAELRYDLICALVAPLPKGTSVVLRCAPGRISDVVGQRRVNLARVRERYRVTVETVREEAGLPRTALAVEWSGGRSAADLLESNHFVSQSDRSAY